MLHVLQRLWEMWYCIFTFLKKWKERKWKDNGWLFQFIFWYLHIAPSKAGGARRSSTWECQRMLSPSKCTISLGELFLINFCWLVIPNVIGLFSHPIILLFFLSPLLFPFLIWVYTVKWFFFPKWLTNC